MPPVTGRREESPAVAGGVTAVDVADFCEEEEMKAAGVARTRENGMVMEAVEANKSISRWWPKELNCVPLSALGATDLDRDIILPAKVMFL